MDHGQRTIPRKISPSEVLESAAYQFAGLIWTTDTNLVITSSYGTGHADLGIEPNQFVGATLQDYFRTKDPKFPVIAACNRVLAGESVTVDLHWQGRDFKSELQPLRDDEGAISGCLGVTRDVTEAKRITRNLPDYIAQMTAITERPPDYVVQIDVHGKITYAQPTNAEGGGTDVVGSEIRKWVHPETLPFVDEVLQQMVKSGQPQHLELPAIGPGGAECWYDVRIRPIKEIDQVVGGVVVVYDITDRKLVEQQLRQSQQELESRVAQRTKELTDLNRQLREGEARLQSILDNSTAVVYMKDLQGRYMLVNSRFTQLFHVTSADLLGRTDLDIFPEEMALKFRENDRRVLDELVPLEFDEIAPQDDGPHNYLSVKVPLLNSDGKPYAVCGISTDITDRKRSEEKLRHEEQLLRKLLELRELERQMISYEIHDGFVQDVVAAKMILESAVTEDGEFGQLVPERREAVRQLLSDAIEEGRRMISELRPMILDEEGIIGSIQYLIAEHLKINNLVVKFTHQVSFHRLASLLEVVVFRIVQEALNNVLRHSQVLLAEIHLEQHGDRLLLEIRDEGIGFDIRRTPPDRFGIRGIVERARLFGGTAVVESAPGQGTRVRADLPVPAAENEKQGAQSTKSP